MFKSNILIGFLAITVFALTAAVKDNTNLQRISQKYKNAKLVEMDVEKTVTSTLLGRETKHSGKIYLSHGKFRWENETPEKSLLVFDGNTIWSEQTPPVELGGPVQVARGKVDKKNRSHILVSSLLGADLQGNFDITSEKIEGNQSTFVMKPKTDDLTIKSVTVVADTKEKTLREVRYEDEVGNETKIKLSNIQFLNKEKRKLFQYQPPKGAQVTDL